MICIRKSAFSGVNSGDLADPTRQNRQSGIGPRRTRRAAQVHNRACPVKQYDVSSRAVTAILGRGACCFPACAFGNRTVEEERWGKHRQLVQDSVISFTFSSSLASSS